MRRKERKIIEMHERESNHTNDERKKRNKK